MAGTQLALVPPTNPTPKPATATLSYIRERWEVEYSRFVCYPPLTSTCPDLVPLPMKVRNRGPGGNWISAASSAMLQLIYDHSAADVILTVCSSGKIQEEHYASKLHFAWPQAACVSAGYPARGSRAIFARYRDSLGEIQKFAVRFVSVRGAETFMNLMKEIFLVGGNVQPLNSDFGCEISTQSEFMSSNRPIRRTSKHSVAMAPARTHSAQKSPILTNDHASQISPSLMKAYSPQMSPSLMKAYSPQMSPSLIYEAAQHSRTQQISPIQNFHSNFSAFPHLSPSLMKAFTPQLSPSLKYEAGQHSETQQISCFQNFQSNIAALPPSFTSLVASCRTEPEQGAPESSTSKEADLKSLIAKCMEDSSFQDILNQVEKVMSEIGGDLLI